MNKSIQKTYIYIKSSVDEHSKNYDSIADNEDDDHNTNNNNKNSNHIHHLSQTFNNPFANIKLNPTSTKGNETIIIVLNQITHLDMMKFPQSY
jgi:hypothetical protein